VYFESRDIETLRKQGGELLRQGHYQQALTHFEQAILLDPRDLSTYNNKVLALFG